MLVSPTEPRELQEIGTASWFPERRGVDVCWRAQGAWWGVQRKTVADFVASMFDGRLAVEVAQMQGGGTMDGVRLPVVVIEGAVRWTNDGELMLARGPRLTKHQWAGRMFSLMLDGVHVAHTFGIKDTIEFIQEISAWSRKKHSSNRMRPGPTPAAGWGSATNKDWARHLLMGFPGVGVDKADEIISHFGRVPMRWDVEEKQMLEVRGIGKKTARAMYSAFEEAA